MSKSTMRSHSSSRRHALLPSDHGHHLQGSTSRTSPLCLGPSLSHMRDSGFWILKILWPYKLKSEPSRSIVNNWKGICSRNVGRDSLSL